MSKGTNQKIKRRAKTASETTSPGVTLTATSNEGLPQGWKWVRVSEVGKIETGSTPSKREPNFYGHEFPFYKPTDLEAGYNVRIARDNLSAAGIQEARFIPANSILVTCIGATIGKTGIIRTAGTCNQQINAIIPSQEFSPNFVYYQTIGPKFQQLIKDNAAATTLPILNKSKFQGLVMVSCPLSEQHVIVSKIEELLSELDKGKQQLEIAQKQLKVYRQAVLKWAFEGKLTNKDVKEGELPEGWRILGLKDITIEKSGLRRGPFGSAIKKEFFVQDGYKIYEQGNAINNDPYRGRYFINEKKYQELINFKVEPGDLIVSCSGVTLGRICEIPSDAKPGVINQALLRIRLKSDTILVKYFISIFRSAPFQRKIFDQSQGTAMPNLVGIKDFKEIKMIVPPIEEQNLIVQEIESRLSVCDKVEETINQSLAQAETLRQSILKKAFEGALVKK